MVIFTLGEMGAMVMVEVVVVGGEGGLAEKLGECAVEVLVVLSLGVKGIREGERVWVDLWVPG
jgi:hypothetical protein